MKRTIHLLPKALSASCPYYKHPACRESANKMFAVRKIEKLEDTRTTSILLVENLKTRCSQYERLKSWKIRVLQASCL